MQNCNCPGVTMQSPNQPQPLYSNIQSNVPQYRTVQPSIQYLPARTVAPSQSLPSTYQRRSRSGRYLPRQPVDDEAIDIVDDNEIDEVIDYEEDYVQDDFAAECENNPQIEEVIQKIINSIPPDACGGGPPKHSRQVIRVKNNEPPKVCEIRRRLPTPEPDTVERVYVCEPPRNVINITIEKPIKPPCEFNESQTVEPAGPPIVHSKVVCVQPNIENDPGSPAPRPYHRPGRFVPSNLQPMPMQPAYKPFYQPFQYQQQPLQRQRMTGPPPLQQATMQGTVIQVPQGPTRSSTQPRLQQEQKQQPRQKSRQRTQ